MRNDLLVQTSQSFDPLGIELKGLRLPENSNCFEKRFFDKNIFHACLRISDCLNLLAQHNISGLTKATAILRT